MKSLFKFSSFKVSYFGFLDPGCAPLSVSMTLSEPSPPDATPAEMTRCEASVACTVSGASESAFASASCRETLVRYHPAEYLMLCANYYTPGSF